jgi:phosphatidylinositol glycan class S
LEPLLQELSLLATYNIKSQWLYFVTLNVQPKLVTESSGSGYQHYALAEDILPQIITPLEKKLGMLFCVYQYISLLVWCFFLKD